VLELHGWGDLQTELNTLSKQGEWVQMGKLVTDDIRDAFAVVGDAEEIPKQILAKVGDAVDRVSFYTSGLGDPEQMRSVIQQFKAA
jgi:hypothetical protein